jgi:hypothetical protein
MAFFAKLVAFGALAGIGLLVTMRLALSGHAALAWLALAGTCAAAVAREPL